MADTSSIDDEAGGSDWRANYWSEPFSLGPQLQKLIDEHDQAADSAERL